MKEIEITSGAYAASWGLTDFYKDSEQALRDAIASGEDFEVHYGCKKEIRYATIGRDADGIAVSVTAHMDDLYESTDLIYDALWEVGKSEEEIPEDVIDSILDEATFFGIEDQSTACQLLPASASFDDICKAINECENEAEGSNNEMFKLLCDIVKAHTA